jgi:hypothetical protein
MRECNFIEFDDDIDIVICFDGAINKKILDYKEYLLNYLIKEGYIILAIDQTHITVAQVGVHKPIDIFIGLLEDSTISVYPCKRHLLPIDVVFPTKTQYMHGIECPLPCDLNSYLSLTYGEDWNIPDSHFSHPWNIDEYSIFM